MDEKDRRTKAAKVYLSALDAEIIDRGARAHDMTRSEYLRACGLATALAMEADQAAAETALTLALSMQAPADA